MKINWKALILALLIPLGIGGLVGLISGDSIDIYSNFILPPLAIPGFLFPIVWAILYSLMGIASYLIYTSTADKVQVRSALRIYGIQLLINFFWSIFFFNLGQLLFAFFWLILLWVLILLNIRKFAAISKLSAILLVPYFLWVSFAGYLNLTIAILN